MDLSSGVVDDELARLREQRLRIRVRSALTTDLQERAMLQASAASIAADIELARDGIRRAMRASADGFNGCCIVLLADEGEMEYATGERAPLHCTIAYLGDTDYVPYRRQEAAKDVAEKIAAALNPFTPTPLSPARFGDEDVLLVEHPDIQYARDIAMSDPEVGEMVDSYPDRHPHFIPHVSGAEEAPRFDRVGLWWGDERFEYPMESYEEGYAAAVPFRAELHPRGRDGRFIEVGGLLNLLGFGTDRRGNRVNLAGHRARVNRIAGPNEIEVIDTRDGQPYTVRPGEVEQAEAPKATLPDLSNRADLEAMTNEQLAERLAGPFGTGPETAIEHGAVMAEMRRRAGTAIGVVPMTRDEFSNPDTPRTRQVTRDEYMALAERGAQHLEQLKADRSPATALDGPQWEQIKQQSWDAVQPEWGGATFDSHTGALATTGYALTMRPPGTQTVTVPIGASRAEFDAAMERAKRRWTGQFRMQQANIGVFRNDDTGNWEIDPVLVVDNHDDVEAIGSYAHSSGGAYNFADGLGYWPPYV